jgi:hypothetical protein
MYCSLPDGTVVAFVTSVESSMWPTNRSFWVIDKSRNRLFPSEEGRKQPLNRYMNGNIKSRKLGRGSGNDWLSVKNISGIPLLGIPLGILAREASSGAPW